MRIEIITNSQYETEAVGEKLSGLVKSGVVVALFGGLGAGKTAFTRGFCRGFGVSDTVTSPTYTIVNEYQNDDGRELFHFDMYRLPSSEALFDIGWEDYLSRGGICVLEWSEHVEDALPPGSLRVSIEPVAELPDRRKITIRGGDLA